ncbi:hypothetical protein HOY80DRAFT_560579 [Tuber brumale]|nr:hypothetical protein HOY80DRAFT_560579 [Tuber brumale]
MFTHQTLTLQNLLSQMYRTLLFFFFFFPQVNPDTSTVQHCTPRTNFCWGMAQIEGKFTLNPRPLDLYGRTESTVQQIYTLSPSVYHLPSPTALQCLTVMIAIIAIRGGGGGGGSQFNQ